LTACHPPATIGTISFVSELAVPAVLRRRGFTR
jgi:hypothetical protein